MNQQTAILYELSAISIHLQYMPMNLCDSKEHQEYFDCFTRALELKQQLQFLKNSGTFAQSSLEPVYSGEGDQ